MKNLLVMLFLMANLRVAHGAHETFEEAIRSGADNVSSQNYAAAKAVYSEALNLAKTDEEKALAQLGLGASYLGDRKFSQARMEFAKVLELKRLSPFTQAMAQLSIGQSYMSETNFVQARAEFAKVLTMQNASSQLKFTTQLHIGQSYLHEKNFAQARMEFAKLLDYKNAVPVAESSAPLFIGKSYLAEGNFEQARAAFAKALGAGEEGASLGGVEQLRAMIRKAVLLNKQSAQLGIAESYRLEGNQARAKAEYEKLLRMDKLDPAVKVEAQKQLKLMGVAVKTSSEPDITISPRQVFLGQVPSGRNITKTIIVESRSERPFSIKSIESKDPHIVAKADPTVVAAAHAVQFDIAVAGKAGAVLRDEVKLTLADGSSLNVPVVGMILEAEEIKPNATAARLEVGKPAPDFFVLDMNGRVWHLAELRGKKNLLLTFFPKCFTGGCANHLASLQAERAAFTANDTEILAVSVDPAEGPRGQIAFAEQWGLEFPLVPDTARKLSMLYGAAQDVTDLATRMSVLIDKAGLVRLIDRDVQVKTHGQDVLARMRPMKLAK